MQPPNWVLPLLSSLEMGTTVLIMFDNLKLVPFKCCVFPSQIPRGYVLPKFIFKNQILIWCKDEMCFEAVVLGKADPFLGKIEKGKVQ